MQLDYLMQYQNEIIAGLAILVTIIIYLLVKNRPTKKETLLEIQPAVHDEYEQEHNRNEKPLPKDIYDQESKAEAEAIPESAPVQDLVTPQTIQEHAKEDSQEKREAKTTEKSTELFQKQPVPPHGKIKKEDFTKFNAKRILLAEDNIINQKVILGLLGSSGMQIVVANDGQEVLDILEKDDDFMLILMDAHMPNIDGLEATKIIRKNPKYNHIPVIALSGDTASDDIKKMLDAGMSDTLEKPLQMDALYDVLYAYDIPQKKETSLILNTTIGLGICAQDKDLYRDVLKEFMDDYANSYNTLSFLIKEKRYADADKLLLDIVGVCANLGLEKLNAVAIQTKEKLKTEPENSDAQLNLYKMTLQRTLDAIKKYFKS